MPIYLCRKGHLRNSQMLADNCSVCKAEERRVKKQYEIARLRKAGKEYFESLLADKFKFAIVVCRDNRIVVELQCTPAEFFREASDLDSRTRSQSKDLGVCRIDSGPARRLEIWTVYSKAQQREVILLSATQTISECEHADVLAQVTQARRVHCECEARNMPENIRHLYLYDVRKWVLQGLTRKPSQLAVKQS